MEQRTTDNVLRKQALDAALSYVAILTPKDKITVGPHLVVEIADTFYQFLCGATENV